MTDETNEQEASTVLGGQNERLVIPFSQLCLGGKFMYIPAIKDHERVYVKISNHRAGGCVAEWDDKNITSGWIGQGIYSLNDTGEDVDIRVVV